MQIISQGESIILRRPNNPDIVLSIAESLRLAESQDLRQAILTAKQHGAETRQRRVDELEAELRKLRSLR